jgi:pimeloyl-ACP methyl ester carboxylesterase
MTSSVTRRALLVGSAVVVGTAIGGAASWPFLPDRIKWKLTGVPDAYIPDAPEGKVTLEQVYSKSRGAEVDFFTAVPAGYGNGKDLPVVVVCHGATATPADYQAFGLPRFLTAAVDAGSKPFVLAGAYGGVLSWEPQPSGDDPQAMVLEEMPDWIEERGFDSSRLALWGWSMGGYGVLRMAEVKPDWAKAVAAFSPAVTPGDNVFNGVDKLAGTPLGVWCGTEDGLFDSVQQLVDSLPEDPEIWSYSEGAHTRIYWNDQTLDAFAFLSSHLH